MSSNFRGKLRGHISTARGVLALVHFHMIRLAFQSSRKDLREYADAVFKLYLQSTCRQIDFLEFTDALSEMGIDNENIQASLIDVGGYRGRPDWERIVLATATRHLDKYPVFEIGTAAGNTTVLLARNTDQTVHTLDLPDSPEHNPSLVRLGSDDEVRAARKRAEFVRRYPSDNVDELLGDSSLFDYSDFKNKIGLFFVDGAHSFEYVKSDTFNACWCCRTDGMVIWDDFTTCRDVTNFIRWLQRQGPKVHGIQGTKLAFSTDIEGLRKVAIAHGVSSV